MTKKNTGKRVAGTKKTAATKAPKRPQTHSFECQKDTPDDFESLLDNLVEGDTLELSFGEGVTARLRVGPTIWV